MGATASPSRSSAPAPSAAATVADCPADARPNRPGPAGQPRPALDGPVVLAAMDPASGVVVLGETGETPSGWALRSTWTFDVCSNTWRDRGRDSLPQAGPELGQLVYVDAPGVVVGLPDGLLPVWTYQVQGNLWSRLPEQDRPVDGAPNAAYDPGARRLLAWDAEASVLRSYGLSGNVWTVVDEPGTREGPRPGTSAEDQVLVVFDTSVAALLLLITTPGSDEPGELWSFNPATGAWQQRAAPPVPERGYPAEWAAAFLPSTSRTYVVGDSVVLDYDAAADAWTVVEPTGSWPEPETLGGVELDPLARSGHALLADPVNSRLVLLGGSVGRSGGGGRATATDDVWAFDPEASRWTLLLADPQHPVTPSG